MSIPLLNVIEFFSFLFFPPYSRYLILHRLLLQCVLSTLWSSVIPPTVPQRIGPTGTQITTSDFCTFFLFCFFFSNFLSRNCFISCLLHICQFQSNWFGFQIPYNQTAGLHSAVFGFLPHMGIYNKSPVLVFSVYIIISYCEAALVCRLLRPFAPRTWGSNSYVFGSMVMLYNAFDNTRICKSTWLEELQLKLMITNCQATENDLNDK